MTTQAFIPSYTRQARPSARRRHQVITFAANHAGAMLAVPLPQDVTRRILLEGGESPEDLHITLFYFGDDAELTEGSHLNIVRLASTLWNEYRAIDISLKGVTVFEDNDERPLVALVASPVLEEYRRRLAKVFDVAGVPYSKDYEYRPHVTLKYLNDAPVPPVSVDESFTARSIEARFADQRVQVGSPRRLFQERPAAGQKQRQGSGDWEGLVNRQQKRLVKTFDNWAVDVKNGILDRARQGQSAAMIESWVDTQMPALETDLIQVTNRGIIGTARTVAAERYDRPEILGITDKQVRDNTALVRANLVPNIRERISKALTGGRFRDRAALNQVFNRIRPMPAQYAGGAWVAIFETARGLGTMREGERAAEGLPLEPVKWVLDPRAEHCLDSPGFYGCAGLAGEYSGGWSTLPTVPAGQVTCRGNCRCHLESYRDGKWQRGVYN